MCGEDETARAYADASVSTLLYDERVSLLAGGVSTSNRRLMARDEDDFRIRPGKVRDRGGGQETARRIGAARGRPTSFVGEVHRAIRRAGGNPTARVEPGREAAGSMRGAGALQRR